MTLDEHKALQLAIAAEAAATIKKLVDERCYRSEQGPLVAYFRVSDGFVAYDTYRTSIIPPGEVGRSFPDIVSAAISLKRNLLDKASNNKVVVWRRDPQITTDGIEWFASARCAFVDLEVMTKEEEKKE